MYVIYFIVAAILSFSTPTKEVKIDSIDPIIEALDRGSSSELAQYFDSSIQLNLNGKQGSYSRSQAEQVLKEFFRKNPPNSFAVVYSSQKNTSINSYVGNYQSLNRAFKVFLKVSERNDSLKLYSLEFVAG